MGKEYELSTCISGSFKFKPEIDRLIEEFQDYHVKVLAPEKGWLVLPEYKISPPKFRPLPSERKMSIRQIEDNFLEKIREATFLYVGNFEGYTGLSGYYEMGFAYGIEKPIYSLKKVPNEENDLSVSEILNFIKVMTPKDTVEDIKKEIEKMLNETE